MSETKNKNKRRLSTITLSLFSDRKTPKIFEDPNGVVGLRIVAAMHDPLFPNKSSNPAPVFSHRDSTRKTLSSQEMEMSEEYICVISHLGKNLVKKREYFDGDFLGATTQGSSDKFIFGTSAAGADAQGDWISSALVDAYSFSVGQTFLNSCFLCKKQLHGLDIFMYRGETAFVVLNVVTSKSSLMNMKSVVLG